MNSKGDGSGDSPYEELQERFKELVICPVCRDTFKHPKILRCGHSFCASCVENVYHRSDNRNCFPCPVCRENIFPPDNAISNFPLNNVIQGILDIMHLEEKMQPQQGSICGFCESPNVLNVCMECNLRMCKKCTSIHNKSNNNSHTVMLMSDVVGTQLIDILNEKEKYKCCSSHNKEVLEICTTCDEVLCEKCTIVHHKNHSLQSIEKAAEGMREFLESKISESTPEIAALQTISEKLRTHHCSLESTTEETKSKIQSMASEMRRLIDMKEKECCKITDDMYHKKSKYILDCLEAAEVQLVKRTNLLEFMKYLHQFGTNLLLAKNKKTIQTRLGQLHELDTMDTPNPEPYLTFSSNAGLLRMMRKVNIGNVHDSSEQHSDTTIGVWDINLYGNVSNPSCSGAAEDNEKM